MRLASLIVTMVVASVVTFYVLTCSVNNAPPAPVHPIVGKWQLVRIGSNFSVGTYPNTTEYTRDGRSISESTSWKYGHVRRKGTYVITDDQICSTQYGQTHSEDGDHYSKIALLDAERLVPKSLDNDTTKDYEYVRVHK